MGSDLARQGEVYRLCEAWRCPSALRAVNESPGKLGYHDMRVALKLSAPFGSTYTPNAVIYSPEMQYILCCSQFGRRNMQCCILYSHE